MEDEDSTDLPIDYSEGYPADDYTIVAPRISGGISVVSSLVILFLIFRSKARLSSVYHRIMFGMSCSDIISSLAIGVTTLPMPRDLPPQYEDSAWAAATRLGNGVQACQAQAFLYMFGVICMFSYYGMLVFYYACTIGFHMRERSIVKFVEPFMHLIPVASGLYTSISAHLWEQGKKTNGWDTWCIVTGPSSRTASKTRLAVYIVSLFLVILFSFALIIWRVCITERSLVTKKISRRARNFEKVRSTHQNSKIALLQALVYILTIVITLIFPLSLTRGAKLEGKRRLLVFHLTVILLPLQGFFNALIFISHKIYNYRRTHPDQTRCHVLRLLFTVEIEEQIIFSRISLIRMNTENKIMEVEIADEFNFLERLHFNTNLDVVLVDNSGHDAFGDADESRRDDLSGFSPTPLHTKILVPSGASAGGDSSRLSTLTPSVQTLEANNSVPGNLLSLCPSHDDDEAKQNNLISTSATTARSLTVGSSNALYAHSESHSESSS